MPASLRRTFLALALVTLGACAHSAANADSAPQSKVNDETRWLESRSMLHTGESLARTHAGTGKMWQYPYAKPQPRAASAMASVWFTAYPAAMLTNPGESVLAALGDEKLWALFGEVGIRGMHTGPMKRSGGVANGKYTPTVDGNFDRIENGIDPAFGTDAEYIAMAKNARQRGAVIIGDVIPGHSGKGPDFRLAERAYGDYPGMYHMVQIEKADWGLLPDVPKGKDSVNLKPDAVDALQSKGYIVGQLRRTIFYEPNVKETDWSATDVVRGVDGVDRRWVYLHYFKEGQPSFNSLDPTFAVQRMLIGDAIHSLDVLGERMLRLDANGFLGIEPGPKGERAWSEGHPLSVTSNQLISGMVRRLGGFTFQELNLTLDDIVAMSNGGADLTYDFVTRPAYHHALASGDTEFLRLMLKEGRRFKIDPAGLIHALQNHDELTLELVHFWTLHKDDVFRFRGKELKGSALRDLIRAEMHDLLLAPKAPFNLKASNGVSCTSASLAAAALKIPSLDALTAEQKGRIQQAHLLLAAYNALQPGVFALSGWDLVGALTLPGEAVKPLLADGDTRWINRGAYDLLGTHGDVKQSATGLPRANALYGPLADQLKDPASFASQLKSMLAVREKHRIHESEQLEVPSTKAKGLLIMVHKLPDGGGTEVTALNFGQTAIDETVSVPAAGAGQAVTDLLSGTKEAKVARAGQLKVQLAPLQAKALLLK